MTESLSGTEMPLAMQFCLAPLTVLGLIGATVWAVSRFGTGRLGAVQLARPPVTALYRRFCQRRLGSAPDL